MAINFATNSVEISRGELLRQKYGQLSVDERQKIINDRLESIAENRLDALEQFIPNAHFKGRHGAQTTLSQQYDRAVNVIDPISNQPRYYKDGSLVTPNSTKYIGHRDLI